MQTVPIAVVMLLAPCLSLAAGSVREHAPPAGLIFASSVYLVETPFESAATLVEAMTRLQQPQPASACCGGMWRVHFVVQLKQSSRKETLDLEFYDVSISDPSARSLRVFSAEIATRPDDTTIFVNDFVISADLGFVAGHEYEVSAWRPTGSGREAVARGRFTLSK